MNNDSDKSRAPRFAAPNWLWITLCLWLAVLAVWNFASVLARGVEISGMPAWPFIYGLASAFVVLICYIAVRRNHSQLEVMKLFVVVIAGMCLAFVVTFGTLFVTAMSYDIGVEPTRSQETQLGLFRILLWLMLVAMPTCAWLMGLCLLLLGKVAVVSKAA